MEARSVPVVFSPSISNLRLILKLMSGLNTKRARKQYIPIAEAIFNLGMTGGSNEMIREVVAKVDTALGLCAPNPLLGNNKEAKLAYWRALTLQSLLRQGEASILFSAALPWLNEEQRSSWPDKITVNKSFKLLESGLYGKVEKIGLFPIVRFRLIP